MDFRQRERENNKGEGMKGAAFIDCILNTLTVSAEYTKIVAAYQKTFLSCNATQGNGNQ